MKFNTRLLHGNSVKAYPDGATVPPVTMASAFAFNDATKQTAVFTHRAPGFGYTRVGNPTVAAFELRIAEAEGGKSAIATGSGMAAISSALLNILSQGDEILTVRKLYGGTIALFQDFSKFGIRTIFAPHFTAADLEPLITDKTRVIFGETIGNPSLEVADIAELSDMSHRHGIPLVIDNTVATPYLVNPIALGADIVIHSATKYINGNGTSVSGVIIDAQTFDWDFDKFSALSEFRKYGQYAYMIRLRTDLAENMGGCLSPVNAFLDITGLETLGLRMERICKNAEGLANALADIKTVSDVNYPTRGRYRELTERELRGYGGGIITFRAGSRERAFSILNNLKIATRATSIGDLRTLVLHPRSTLYYTNSDDECAESGIYDDTIRISTGIEDLTDLIDDFIQATEKT